MLEQVHFLLSYACNYECDHCFLYCSPKSKGTFNIHEIRNVLEESKKLGTVEWIYFEGGEPFLYFPLMIEGLRLAKDKGFKTGVVTNCYWATSHDDAILWLKPLVASDIDSLVLSDDSFHHDMNGENPATIGAVAAASLGLSTKSICIEKPSIQEPAEGKGDPVVGGGAHFKGRAVEKLVGGLPVINPNCFNECIHEELVTPKRVHIDSYGNVMVCQGVSIGNMWQKPFSQIIKKYNAGSHPVCGPLVKGGPLELSRAHGIEPQGQFMNECHYCYMVRKELIHRFPEELSPRQVYGLE